LDIAAPMVQDGAAMQPAPIAEWRDVDAARFRSEIAPRSEPAVLRGLVQRWPAVGAGRASAQALMEYLLSFDRGEPAEVMSGEPSIGGRFFYNADLTGFNFTKSTTPFAEALARMCASLDEAAPPALAIQAAGAAQLLPGFEQQNTLDGFALAPAAPRLWIGNTIVVQTHCDMSENLACVVGGRRRFTLFPPSQIANLYVAPLNFTPAGTPVSMADLDAPDFMRHPRFAAALETAQSAELEPGDAIYIPYMWWHHVASLSPFNMLVNYWWNDARTAAGAPFDALLYAMLNLRLAPAAQRAAWRAAFDYFVFLTDGDPAAHLPPDRRGVQGPITREAVDRIKERILATVARPPR
jgi:Cupin-like domain